MNLYERRNNHNVYHVWCRTTLLTLCGHNAHQRKSHASDVRFAVSALRLCCSSCALQASLIAQQINEKPGFYAMSTREQPDPKVHQMLHHSVQGATCVLFVLGHCRTRLSNRVKGTQPAGCDVFSGLGPF